MELRRRGGAAARRRESAGRGGARARRRGAAGAEGAGGIGVCEAQVDLAAWPHLYSLAEAQGDIALACGGTLPDAAVDTKLVDRRSDAAVFAGAALWRVG